MHEPLAIVGIGCRFPGDVDSPAALSKLLVDKRSAIGDVPADRWNAETFFHPDFRKPGSIHVRRGGFLSRIDEFDAAFFGISPNEARRMDPQQRHVLETSFAAICDAGVRVEHLAGKDVACIIGAGSSDYASLCRTPSDRPNISGTTNPGAALSIISNRVSYVFDLRGPSFTVDTACSSSLTALHYVCKAIWDGAAIAGIAGGVNSIISPEITMGFSKGGYLSPDAECRAFSDHANGYVRSEGVGAVFVKPLSTALADGDRIYALIRGTWINQDGLTAGMTVPSVEAQERLLRGALRQAEVHPQQIAYVEAHGTGTPAGDPIEASAIGAVVGKSSGRKGACFIGSVKTNLGHMECAAGMGGLVKLALVLSERRVLPNIHFRAPNPKIDFDGLGLALATDCVPLAREGSIFGGVNSFGFGGANGHAVLESPPPARPSRHHSANVGVKVEADGEPRAFLISARSSAALRSTATALAAQLELSPGDLESLHDALVSRRSHFEFRAAVVASEPQELRSSLELFAKADREALGERAADVLEARVAVGHAEPTAFVYTGQGPQWFAMGRKLLDTNATFRRVVTRVDEELRRHRWLRREGSSLFAELARDEASSRMGETRIAQPCIFALQLGLTEILRERGVVPAAVAGHSIGELAAAVTAGALSLEEGARVVYWRSECQAAAEGRGSMLALAVDEAQANALVRTHEGVEIAAYNGPSAITLAGLREPIGRVAAELLAKGTFNKKLDVSVPFHCFLMDPIEADFRARLGDVRTSKPDTPFFSTVRGQRLADALDADYWYANIRQPVRYHQAFRAMLSSGLKLFVEIGPHPALTHGSVDAIRSSGKRATWIPTLQRDGDDARSLARTSAALLVHGAIEVKRSTTHVELPAYPFERNKHWIETDAGRSARLVSATATHPHLGPSRTSVHAPDVVTFDLELDPRVEPYVGDHRAQGHIIFPAAGQLELVLAAARSAFGTPDVVVEHTEFKRPIALVATEARDTEYRLEVYSEDGSFAIVSRRGAADAAWVEHTTGLVRRSRVPEDVAGMALDIGALRARHDVEIPQADFYRACEAVGLELGPSFRNLTDFRRDRARTEIFCEIDCVGIAPEDRRRFICHPALLDATVHSLLPVDAECSSQRLFLPFQVECLRVFGPVPAGRFYSHARVLRQDDSEFCASVRLCDADGRVFALLDGLVARHVRGSETDVSTDVAYEHAWTEKARAFDVSEAARPHRGQNWIVLASAAHPSASRAIQRKLAARGARVVTAFVGRRFDEREPTLFECPPDSRDDAARLAAAVGGPVSGVVHLWSLDLPSQAGPLEAARLGASTMAHLVSALSEADKWADEREAWLVTLQATTPDGADTGKEGRLAAASMWGFGRTLMTEQPRVAVTLVDVGSASSASEAEALAEEIVFGPTDAEVAYRGTRRFARILSRAYRSMAARPLDIATTHVRAAIRSPGVLDSLALEQFHLPDCGPDEIEVAIRAVGLNFRDVVAATNMLPKDAWKGGFTGSDQLGLDAAGVVTHIGSKVEHLRVGDAVCGFFSYSLATRAIGTARHAMKLAPGLTMVEAAAILTPHITVDLAFGSLAHLDQGETVLIHAAAGGVGTLAVQAAHARGAAVIATTSSEEKRAFLRGLGVKHIFNSRSPDFGDDVMRVTNGEGVDVVLNSVAGRAMTESLRCLKPFGRFIEIGKADVYKNRQIGLRQFGENKSYFCLDINRIYTHPKINVPALIEAAMLARTQGFIKTLPITTMPFEESAAALRHLAQGKQIGRLVVEVPSQGTVVAEPSHELRLDPTAAYVVTGGCAGFGLELAQWLTQKGARHLVLAGRRGLPGADEERRVGAMREAGVEVDVRRADVSRQEDVAALIANAKANRRIGGIFHAAMVLDDGPIHTLTTERWSRVLAPKAQGAIHLHEATKGRPLDYFVLFSSVSSVLGTPGQANYAAANAVLDELAASRRAARLPATSINFGVIEDVGVVARSSSEQRRKILAQGVRGMSSRRALELLEKALHDGVAQRVVAHVDGRAFARLGGSARRFDPALGDRTEDRARSGESLRETLLAADEEARPTLLADALARLLSSIAGLGSDHLDHDSSMSRYGFDSLMIAQVQTWIDEQLGVSVGMVRLLRGPSVRELTTELLPALSAARGSSRRANPLLRPLKTHPDPRFRVVCFPPMAVSADAFASFAGAVPADVDVYALALPTFGDERAELLLKSSEEVMDHVLSELDELQEVRSSAGAGNVPTAFYGHSMGGYVALDVARAALERGTAKPAFVAVAAMPTPNDTDSMRATVRTPEDVTREMADALVRSLNTGASQSSLEMGNVVELARRDLWLAARGSRPDARAVRGIPSLLLAGAGDPLATIDKQPKDARDALGYDEIATVPGGHLFFLDAEGVESLVALVVERMARLDVARAIA